MKPRCLLAPLLFILYINELSGALVVNSYAPSLAYYDVLARSRMGLLRLLECSLLRFQTYCIEEGLVINCEISKVMVFLRASWPKQLPWKLNNQQLIKCPSFII